MNLTEALQVAKDNTNDSDPVRKEAMDYLANEVTLLKKQLYEAVMKLKDAGIE